MLPFKRKSLEKLPTKSKEDYVNKITNSDLKPGKVMNDDSLLQLSQSKTPINRLSDKVP